MFPPGACNDYTFRAIKHKLHAVLQVKEYPPNRPYEVTETDTSPHFYAKNRGKKKMSNIQCPMTNDEVNPPEAENKNLKFEISEFILPKQARRFATFRRS